MIKIQLHSISFCLYTQISMYVTPAEKKDADERTVVVGNLDVSLTPSNVASFFGGLYSVAQVRIQRDVENAIAHVVMRGRHQLPHALRHAGVTLNGRRISVRLKCSDDGDVAGDEEIEAEIEKMLKWFNRN